MNVHNQHLNLLEIVKIVSMVLKWPIFASPPGHNELMKHAVILIFLVEESMAAMSLTDRNIVLKLVLYVPVFVPRNSVSNFH